MARRYFSRKVKSRGRGKDEVEDRLMWGLDPETRRSIIGIVFIVIGLVAGLGVLGWGGVVGDAFGYVLRLLFGYISYPVPFIMLVIGIVILAPTAFEFRASSYIGIISSLVFAASIAHIFITPANSFEMAKEGVGGGLIGFAISFGFRYIFDFWASLIVFVGALLISLLVAFNFSLRSLIQKVKIYLNERDKSGDEDKPKKKKKSFSLFGRKQKVNKPQVEKEEVKEPEQPIAKDENWNFPPLKLLDDNDTNPKAGNIKKNTRIIEETLNNFNVDVSMSEVNVGPTVSQYTLKPSTGIKLNQITARVNDVSLALAAHPIRIEAPIPGRSAVGIEVPNKVPAIVKLRKILASDEFKKDKNNLKFVLGRDVSGEPQFDNLETMPHLLIAGATGSGKSVCINSILTTFLYNNSPRDMRLILVDPKRVEFTPYDGIPHLLTPVITSAKETVSALKWSVSEMERRYDLFQQEKKRNLESYNKSVEKDQRLPMIVIVIDELADLMSTSAREVEAAIVRLTQMARATGIHMIVATQRPSVDVITGLIKANITHRIAFAVASQVDSRTILDQSGAEKLLGNGDMLYLSKKSPKPTRIQGVFLEDNEINRVTEFLQEQAEAKYNEEITKFKGEIESGASASGFIDNQEEENDEYLEEAARIVVENQKGSASLLQRRLSIGYARAARILDELQSFSVVGPSKDSKPRDVLVNNLEELETVLEQDSQKDKDGENINNEEDDSRF